MHLSPLMITPSAGWKVSLREAGTPKVSRVIWCRGRIIWSMAVTTATKNSTTHGDASSQQEYVYRVLIILLIWRRLTLD